MWLLYCTTVKLIQRHLKGIEYEYFFICKTDKMLFEVCVFFTLYLESNQINKWNHLFGLIAFLSFNANEQFESN